MGEKLLEKRPFPLVAEQMTSRDAVGTGSAGTVAQALLFCINNVERPCGVDRALANQFAVSGVEARLAVEENQLVSANGHGHFFSNLAGADTEDFSRWRVAERRQQRDRVLIEDATHPLGIDSAHRATVQIIDAIVDTNRLCGHHVAAQNSQVGAG